MGFLSGLASGLGRGAGMARGGAGGAVGLAQPDASEIARLGRVAQLRQQMQAQRIRPPTGGETRGMYPQAPVAPVVPGQTGIPQPEPVGLYKRGGMVGKDDKSLRYERGGMVGRNYAKC